MKALVSLLVPVVLSASTLAVTTSPAGARERPPAGPAPHAAAEAAAEAPAAPSLYDRLGGVTAIAVVVDDFIERLLVNETLNANPAIDEARHRVPKQGLKFHVTTLVCQVTGGPCAYVGRDMRSSHAHLRITEEEWQAMAADFRKTLDHFGVPAAEQAELFAIVGSTKPEIVIGAKAASH